MKVYELILRLVECPAGAKVRIYMLKGLGELPRQEGDLREIDFEVRDVQVDENVVTLDGWAE